MTRYPWSPRLLTGDQRTRLREQLEVLRETAERVGRPGTVDIANRWASLLQRAPSIEAAHVTDFREEVDRCRACVERSLEETSAANTTEAAAILTDADRRAVGRLVDSLQLYPLISVPVAVAPSAYLTATEFSQLTGEVNAVLARERLMEPHETLERMIPFSIESVARQLGEAADGTEVRMAAVADGRAWAMGHLLDAIRDPEMPVLAALVVTRAGDLMRNDVSLAGATRVQADLVPLRTVPPRPEAARAPEGHGARLLDDLTRAIQHVTPPGLHAAVEAGQRHCAGFADSADATQRVMMRAAVKAYLESSGIGPKVAELAETIRRQVRPGDTELRAVLEDAMDLLHANSIIDPRCGQVLASVRAMAARVLPDVPVPAPLQPVVSRESAIRELTADLASQRAAAPVVMAVGA